MANLKIVIFEDKPKENGECLIYVQLTHKRKVTWISSGIYVLPQNFKATRVQGGKNGDQNASLKNVSIGQMLTKFEKKLIGMGAKLDMLDVKAIKRYLVNHSDKFYVTDFKEYTKNKIEELTIQKKDGTIGPLSNTLNRIKEFHLGALDFSEITVSFLQRFIAHQAKLGKKKNTIAVYLRYIRSMFNSAIDEYNVDLSNVVITNYPFRKFHIETEVTKHRNLSIDMIRIIRDAELPTIKMEIARDMFMLQLYLMGINSKDLFYMRKENVKKDRLKFNRHKTNRFYNIKIEPEAEILLQKYEGQKFLLWFADFSLDERNLNYKAHTRRSEFQYANSQAFNKMLNQQLRRIKIFLGLEIEEDNLTTYFSRHSFASIAREIGVSRDDISLCLGHRSPEHNLVTTGIYINEDYSKADKANRLFIDLLNKEKLNVIPIIEL